MAKVKKLGGPPVRTMKVKLLKGVVLGSGQVGKAGEIFELARSKATELIFTGMAEETDEGDPVQLDETPADEKDVSGVATIERPHPRDPKPTRRG